jgi:hypothetical protein
MRNKMAWLASTLVVALALAGMVAAEPQKEGCAKETGAQVDRGSGFRVSQDGVPGEPGVPGDRGPKKGKKGGKGDGFKGGKKGGKGGFRGGLTVDEIVERLMAFDKNKDGKLTKDELPERMQDLIAKGDTNNDGALDRDEIRKLATVLARDGFAFGFGGPGGGFGPGPRGGFGPGLKGGPRPGGAERAVADLRLSGKTKEKAEAVLKAHQENVRKLMDLARSDLLVKMKDVLSEQEYKTFKEGLDRQPGPFPVGGPRPVDVDRRLEQLQRELDDLRRELRR